MELAAQGCGRAEIAAALQISTRTLSAWMKAHPEFRDAMTRAKEIEYAWWLAAGRKGQFMRNWNASGWALQMRNRFRKRFRDRERDAKMANLAEAPLNTEQLREEIEQKLSRLADSREEDCVSLGTDGGATGTPQA
jgi:hypothetical protein